MLFERLSIENYGVYADKSDFDLTTTSKKPIILVGGTNGAGKTTIFESIMIALYGRIYFGRKITKKEYTEFIIDRIHRHDNKRAKQASVEITFKFYHNGSVDSYAVKREWMFDGRSLHESLQLQKNGKLMMDVNESLWQSFIEGLIPLGISKLFFYDGEKIMRITNWNEKNNEELNTSLEMLLGGELIHRLQADLELYTIRKSSDRNNDNSVQKEYEKLRNEKDELVSDIDLLDIERDRKNNDIDKLTLHASSKESKIAGIGGGYANIRSNLLTEKAVLEEKIRHYIKEIQEELANDTPLYIASSILSEIGIQIKTDSEIMQKNMSKLIIQKKVNNIKNEISDKEFWPDGIINNIFAKKLTRRLDSLIKEHSSSAFFDMSPKEVEWAQQKISKIKNGSNMLSKKLEEYTKMDVKLGKIESDLAKIPQDDELGPKISEINNLHQEIGILKGEIMHIDQQISSKQAYQKILQTKLKGLIDTLYKNKTMNTGVELASKIQKILSAYYTNLRERKIIEIESHLLNTANILLHKNLISKIEVDRKSFEIRVSGNDNEMIPGGLLSMGERQIIGTALLWAISRACGRALPFVIDTPLSRLDNEHLVNITEKFYPFASHQLILLSTDREIGPKEYEKLSKYISHSYSITCDHSQSITTVRKGYLVG